MWNVSLSKPGFWKIKTSQTFTHRKYANFRWLISNAYFPFLIQIISQPFDVVFAPLAAEELKIIEVDLGAPESYVTLEFYANPTPSSDQVNSYNRIKTFSTHNTFASTGDLAHCKGQCGRFPSISCRDDPGSLQRQNARLLASQRSDNQSGEFRPRPSNPRH